MSIEHSLTAEHIILKKTEPSMAFDSEKESLENWKSRSREKLRELLGLDLYEQCEDDFIIENTEETDDRTTVRFTFKSEENCTVPCCFVIPKKKESDKPPVMICLQGHGTGMHISLGVAKYDIDEPKLENGDRDFANQCVERGICALAVEQRCFGERGGNPRPDCHTASLTALLTGRTLIGGRVWDIMRVIDVLEKHMSDKCDTKRIYCMGNSGGGTATFYASALEDRIIAAMPSCAFCTFADSIGAMHHCECNYIPNIARYFDMAELAGMSAPKPIVVVSGQTDGIFPVEGAKSEFERLKEIYSSSSAPDNCVHVIGEYGHRFYAEEGWKAFYNLI